MRTNDFTYVPPGLKHSIGSPSDKTLRVLVMGFKIPASISIGAPLPKPKIVNLDDVKEETVEGHPTSVVYKLLLGPRTGERDAIDDAYVVVSFFWMNFAPGGTNFPHHHETAEEIYLVLDGEGEMVAGGGMDGIEGRHPAKAGDAYYFRPNCTVGFYNQNKPGARAHILAVRSQVSFAKQKIRVSSRGVLMRSPNSSRRSFIKLLAAAPLLSQIAVRELYAQAATAIGKDPRQNIYTRLGVKTVINCRGTWTYLSGSLEFPEVRQAQVEAAQHFVNMFDLQHGVGRRLSELTGAESGIVTSGAAGAMAAATRRHVWPAATTNIYGSFPTLLA